MTMRTLAFAGTIAAISALANADSPKSQGGAATPAFRQAIPNIPGKSLITVVVDYAPGAKSPPHHHAGSAFVAAYVLSGAIRSQVDDQPARIYRASESWFEAPGAHHKISENASTSEPARLLAIFVADSGEAALTRFDRH
jgi:quercetin dioxygenase-like cupin family protein